MAQEQKTLTKVEEEIAALKASADARSTSDFLRQLIDKYEARIRVLTEEIDKLQAQRQSTDDTLSSLRKVLMLNAGAEVEQDALFSGMSTRECVERVLEREGTCLSAFRIAQLVEAGGKNLGSQPTASIINAVKRYLGRIFVREKISGKYYYGLKRWGDNVQFGLRPEG